LRFALLILFLSAPVTQCGTHSANDSLARQIDKILQETFVSDEPGATTIVIRDGNTIYRGAIGMANVELGVPLKPEMVFRLGSLTKQFTAAAILLLEEKGKLKLDDTIDKYLPDYPKKQASNITIEHLLTHTSGIFSYTSIPGYMNSDKLRRHLSTAGLIDVFKELQPDFAPGEKWKYSNSGYVLLGAIIEAVSRISYEDFIHENIFDKLGMENSHYGSHTKIIPNRASGYEFFSTDMTNARFLSMTQPHAAGSILSNVDDFATWDRALFSGQILSKTSLHRMTSRVTLNSGEEHNYGYGLAITEINGHKMFAHGGGIFGFATFALHVVDENLFVAVFANSTNRQRLPGRVAQRIAKLILGDQ